MTMTIEKLPSGYWQIVIHDDHGRLTEVMEFPRKRVAKRVARLWGGAGKISKVAP